MGGYKNTMSYNGGWMSSQDYNETKGYVRREHTPTPEQIAKNDLFLKNAREKEELREKRLDDILVEYSKDKNYRIFDGTVYIVPTLSEIEAIADNVGMKLWRCLSDSEKLQYVSDRLEYYDDVVISTGAYPPLLLFKPSCDGFNSNPSEYTIHLGSLKPTKNSVCRKSIPVKLRGELQDRGFDVMERVMTYADAEPGSVVDGSITPIQL